MKKTLASLTIAAFFTTAVVGQDFTNRFEESKMRERVIRLSADDMEGRGPGTPGGMKAAEYIADQLKAAGVKPANKGSYFQTVKLIGAKADPNSKLEVGGKSYKFADDFVATTSAQKADVAVDAELVFAGYGIDASNFNWNDYSGDPNDYRGKVLMIMVNDPPATKAEPNLFGGKALTYYGRWTYKYEEAARRGAAGVILIHTTESAGYGWNVVRSSNGNWRYEVLREAGDKTPFLDMKSWVTEETAKSIMKSANLDLDDLRAKASVRGFKPVKTGLKVKLNLKSEMKSSDSPNVVGIVKGRDKKLKKEYIVYTAHYDHLGIGEPDARGDKIFNGAYDNASGVATVIAIGEAFAKMPKSERPKRSIMVILATAEEQGLLGAEYYSLHPLVPLNKTAANVNIDGVNFFGKTIDFSALGAERSSIESVVNEAARERRMTVEGDMKPEQGFFFRSDHFPFARVGVPAMSLRHGDDFVTPLKGDAESFFKGYTEKYYHQPSDEYHEWWDASAMVQEAELALAIGIKLANLPSMPRYKDSDEFAAADKTRFK